jgi:hypothetical protein
LVCTRRREDARLERRVTEALVCKEDDETRDGGMMKETWRRRMPDIDAENGCLGRRL